LLALRINTGQNMYTSTNRERCPCSKNEVLLGGVRNMKTSVLCTNKLPKWDRFLGILLFRM
jgi:hypothetical protein